MENTYQDWIVRNPSTNGIESDIQLVEGIPMSFTQDYWEVTRRDPDALFNISGSNNQIKVLDSGIVNSVRPLACCLQRSRPDRPWIISELSLATQSVRFGN